MHVGASMPFAYPVSPIEVFLSLFNVYGIMINCWRKVASRGNKSDFRS